MKPHRPIDLDLFNENFFSGKDTAENSPDETSRVFTAEGKTPDTVKNEEKQKLHPSLTADVIEGLMKLQLSQNSPVFHTLPDDDEKAGSPSPLKEAQPASQPQEETNQPVAPSKRTPKVSEEEALKSFPDFEFDPKIFDVSENETPHEIIPVRGNAVFTEDGKTENHKIKNDKIKSQKKLEKKIRRPFMAKRLFAFLMVIFILIGIAGTGFAAVLYKTGNTPESTLDIGNYSVCYIDGENIESSLIRNGLVVMTQEKITGKKTILYRHNDTTRLEKIVGVGEESYGVRYEGNPMQVISSGEIKGVALFTLGNIKPIYETAHYQPVLALTIIAVYFIFVLTFFPVLISLRNKKIKKYRESYQIVS